MGELRRTVSLHPTKGGTFDVVLQSRDEYAHSALTSINPTAGKQLEDILTEATNKIRKVIEMNTDWDSIGR